MESDSHSHSDKGVLHMPWEHAGLKLLAAAGVGTAGLAVLPALFSNAGGMAGFASAMATSFCSSGNPSGWAGSVAGVMEKIPLVGESLAAGGLATAGASIGLALGALWLSNYVDKHTEKGAFRWGSVIRWAGLATSVLVGLPMILPAISMGLMFLGTWLNVDGFASAAKVVGSLGSQGAMSGLNSAVGAAGMAGVHAITCALPLGLSGLFLGQEEEKVKPFVMPKFQLTLPALRDGMVMPPLTKLRSAG